MSTFQLDPRSLHQLRLRLSESDPESADQLLREAGAMSGALLRGRWHDRLLRGDGLADPGRLDTRWFGPILREVTTELGWGSLAVHQLGTEAILFESADWAEAVPGSSNSPGCSFTAGALSAFLSEEADAPLATLEVECRSAGAEACRFLVASAETLSIAGDLVDAGSDWREAFPAVVEG